MKFGKGSGRFSYNAPMAVRSKRRWFQFSLRTLLVASVAIAVFLGWWFRPFVIETRRQDGSLRRQFTVCRDWRGGLVSHGKQTWHFYDGKRFETTSYGVTLDQDEFKSLLPTEHEFDYLIELIIDTVEPESWPKNVNVMRDLEFGRGQTVVSDGAPSR